MKSDLPINEYGVYLYPKGDLRRLLVLAAAIDFLRRPTLRNLAKFTGQNTGSIHRDVRKINAELGMRIIKDGAAFRVAEWGDWVRREVAMRRLCRSPDTLIDPSIEESA